MANTESLNYNVKKNIMDVKTEMSRQRCQDRDVKTEMEGKRGTSENPSMTKKAERKRSFRRATLFFSASSTFITVLTVSL